MAGQRVTALSPQQRAVLDELGIDVWVSRNAPLTELAVAGLPDAATETAGDSLSKEPERSVLLPATQPDMPTVPTSLDWDALNAAIRSCTKCGLHEHRTQAVCGVGSTQADWLVIGEAPGADEDLQGEPFVGRAGQLLNEMLRAVGLARPDVFIANILKCRPPNNRDPQVAEVTECLTYLQRQIELLQPRLILLVGRIAAQNLLQTEEAIGKLRGRVHRYGDSGIPVVVTYHPAYLLRRPSQKRKSWDDLCLAMDVAAGKSGMP